MDKLEIFRPYLDFIKSERIRSFTEYCILKFPNYYWKIYASTSGLNHSKNETLLDHILGCLFFAKEMCERQLKDHLNDKQKDQLISAVILHDGWRCHNADGSLSNFTKEDVERIGLPNEKIGQWKTSREHPEAGYKNLLKLSLEFNKGRDEMKKDRISSKELDQILLAVRRHYGTFTTGAEIDFSWSWPADNLSLLLIMIDAGQAINASWWSKHQANEKERVKNIIKPKEIKKNVLSKSYCKEGMISSFDEYSGMGLIRLGDKFVSFSQWDYVGDTITIGCTVKVLFNALGQVIKIKGK